MDKITVNTDKIRECANSISNYNDKIDDAFKNVIKAISNIEGSWFGTAKDNTIAKFNEIKKYYIDNSGTSRKSSINQYVKFLSEYVGDVYDEVEISNTSLADAFK